MTWNVEYLQSQSYPAIRDRVVLSRMGMQRGVLDDTDFGQGATGSMTFQILAGEALVPNNAPGGAGFYHVENDATMNVTVPDASTSNPRLDQIVLTVKDPSYDPTITDSTPVLQVIPGTPTAGATLDNRLGAVSATTPGSNGWPYNSIRIADVLVPTSTSVLGASAIRDRRTWARGCFKIQRLSIGGDPSSAAISPNEITNMRQRCELTGDHPVEVTLQGQVYSSAAATFVRLAPLMISPVDQATSVFLAPNGLQTGDGAVQTNQSVNMRISHHQRTVQYITQVNANTGSCIFSAYYRPVENPVVGNTGSVSVAVGRELVLTIRELLHGPSYSWPTS